MNLQKTVLEFRSKHSLSQRKFAKLCGISPTTLQKIEFGKEPGLIVAGKIRKFMDSYDKEA